MKRSSEGYRVASVKDAARDVSFDVPMASDAKYPRLNDYKERRSRPSLPSAPIQYSPDLFGNASRRVPMARDAKYPQLNGYKERRSRSSLPSFPIQYSPDLFGNTSRCKYLQEQTQSQSGYSSEGYRDREILSNTSSPARPSSSLKKVDLKSSEGMQILAIFQTTWAPAKGTCPQISYLFSVTNEKLKTAWDVYKQSLIYGTVEKHFHGTKLECDITKQGTLCSNNECGICGIARSGFNRKYIRKNINFQRFGHGFYVAPNSSKCHDYTQGKYGYRAMILLDVCPGMKYELKTDDRDLQRPPHGYNSVHGKRGPRLNYDELVLYNPHGALPRYIIIYQHDGEHKIA